MGISIPFAKHGTEFDAHTRIEITDVGSHALDEDVVRNIKERAILDSLEMRKPAPMTISELSQEAKVSIMDTRNHISKLSRGKMVKICEE